MAIQSPASYRAIWRFTLRSLLLSTTIVAVVFAIWSERARRQRSAVKGLRELGAGVYYDYEGTRWAPVRGEPFVGSKWLGTDYVHNATWVMLDDDEVVAALPLLKKLPCLRHVQLVYLRRANADEAANILDSELAGVGIELEPAP